MPRLEMPLPAGRTPAALLPWLIGILLVAAAAINPIDFITGASEFHREINSTGGQTLLKLAIAVAVTLAGATGAISSRNTRALLGSLPGVGLLALAAVFCVTSLFAASAIKVISLAASLIFLGYLLFIATAIVTLGVRRVVICLTLGTTLYLLFTWGLFVLSPEKGRFIEYTGHGEIVYRMGGSGHPNMIAKVAVAAGLMALAMLLGQAELLGRAEKPSAVPLGDAAPRRRWETPADEGPLTIARRSRWLTWLWGGVIVISVATAVATLSRTAVLAGMAAVGVMLINRLLGRGGVIFGLSASTIALAFFLVVSLTTGADPFAKSAMEVVTKSGNVDEITSLTGRTVIWQEAIGLIAQRPLTGWGLDSAATVMSREATGTHNLLLHVTFSAGVVAGGVMLALLGWSLLFGITSPEGWIRGVMVFVLISGLVEDTLFESFPTLLTLLWLVGLLAPHLPHVASRADRLTQRPLVCSTGGG